VSEAAKGRALGAAVVAVLIAGLAPATASAKTEWLCRPGLAENPCTPSLRTTVFSPWSRAIRTTAPRRVVRPKLDCFYVYPTTSNQPTTLATKAIDPELRSIALYQAARYSQLCRVFAPVYRQITVPALGRGGVTAADVRTAYGDVAEAWEDYLRHDNRGRGVVLIGHSQGAAHLQRLVRARIDRRPSVRRRLVSAILLGGNVTVRRGSDAGGVFRRIPACRSRTQLACVVAFSAFDETPPANTMFGAGGSRLARFFGLPEGRGYEVLCTNPARLRGGAAPLDPIFPTAPFAPGTLIAAGISLLGFGQPAASTPFVEAPGAFTGRCSSAGGAHVLRIASRNGTPVPKASPDVTWGLHLLDANVAQGDLLRLVASQARAYARRAG
jgi:hypothetical protein